MKDSNNHGSYINENSTSVKKNSKKSKLFYAHREIVFLFVASLIAITLAHIIEYMGYAPCKLCYYQRYAYYTIAGTCFFVMLFRRKLIFFLILLFILFAEMGVAVFHAGVEHGVWKYESTCATEQISDTFVSDITSILEQDIVRCDIPQIVIYGISMTEWNVLYTFFVIIIFIYLSYANKKRIDR